MIIRLADLTDPQRVALQHMQGPGLARTGSTYTPVAGFDRSVSHRRTVNMLQRWGLANISTNGRRATLSADGKTLLAVGVVEILTEQASA